MRSDLAVGNVSRKSRAEAGTAIADGQVRTETDWTGSGTFLGPVTAGNEAVERVGGGGTVFFSDPLRTFAAEQHSRHSADSFASADSLLTDNSDGGGGSYGVPTNGRNSTDRGSGGGTPFFSDPLRPLTVERHSQHSVESFASADCLLADSGGGVSGGGSCSDGRSSTDGGMRADEGGGGRQHKERKHTAPAAAAAVAKPRKSNDVAMLLPVDR